MGDQDFEEADRLLLPKLTPAVVQRLWLAGLPLHEIASTYGIAVQTAEDTMRKRTARLVREMGKR